VKFLNSDVQLRTKLVAFISIRNYRENKNKIQGELLEAIVIPMVPGIKHWRLNRFLLGLLCWRYNPDKIIARSVLATQLAFKTSCRNIVYDGRGAIAAEWTEYDVVKDRAMVSEIVVLEKQAVLNAQWRIAVSQKLVEYWQSNYQYSEEKHEIIPCTLNSVYEQISIEEKAIKNKRLELGFSDEDIICVYSGSLAGWQSFDLLYSFIEKIILTSSNIKFLFLSEQDKMVTTLIERFPNKIFCKKVQAKEVPDYLIMCDFGLLIRDISTTNKVASPVKFAEYLACGLHVLISENLGDYSEFVKIHACGQNYLEVITLQKKEIFEKQKIRNLGLTFIKKQYLRQYKTVASV
jgi:hypothetical protein